MIARPVPTTADIGSFKNLSISLRRALRPPVRKPRCAHGRGLGWGKDTHITPIAPQVRGATKDSKTIPITPTTMPTMAISFVGVVPVE